jgi:4-hydroxymandelate oxidase
MVDIDQLEQRFQSIATQTVFDWVARANGSLTYRWNIAAWDAIALSPHVLRGASARPATDATVLGQPVATPVLLSPAGMPENLHPEQELDVARGAAAAGSLISLSQWSTKTMEEVASAAPGVPRWFQLYLSGDRGFCAELLQRAEAAGYSAIVLTVDVGHVEMPHVGGGGVGDGPRPDSVYASPPMVGRDPFDGTLSLRDISWLKEKCSLPIVVKGVLRADDAVECVQAGADAIQVSNHGGRTLDTAVPSAVALPAIAHAVEGRAEVYVDGGIRHGRDVIKALALGARAVFIGEPWMVAVTVGGAAAVTELIAGLTYELAHTMNQCGLSRLSEISANILDDPKLIPRLSALQTDR